MAIWEVSLEGEEIKMLKRTKDRQNFQAWKTVLVGRDAIKKKGGCYQQWFGSQEEDMNGKAKRTWGYCRDRHYITQEAWPHLQTFDLV